MSGLFTSLAVMMSPRGLTALGNGAGMGGVVFMGLLAFAAFASIHTARSMGRISSGEKRVSSFDGFALGFLDAGRLFTLAVLAVSWLGIAGYAFNEIFFLWFPNLSASFLLLALAAAACIFSDDGMEMFIICLTLGFCAFAYLAVMSTQPLDTGIGYPTAIPAIIQPLIPEGLLQSGVMGIANLVFVAALVFIGFDLPMAFGKKASKVTPSVLLILVTFVIFSWGALLLVPAESLVESSVPHINVAMAAMGEMGRALMGGVIVLGTVAALIAFFQIAGQRVKGIVTEEYSCCAPRAMSFVLAVIIGVLLAMGWAGEEALESLISAGLCFWFGTYALVDLLQLIGKRKAGAGFISTLLSLGVLALHGLAAVFSAMFVEFPMHFYYALAGMAVAGLVFGFGYYRNEAPMRAEAAEEKALAAAELAALEENPDLDADGGSNDEALNIVSYK